MSDCPGGGDGRGRQQHVLDDGRVDVVPAADDEVLRTAHQAQGPHEQIAPQRQLEVEVVGHPPHTHATTNLQLAHERRQILHAQQLMIAHRSSGATTPAPVDSLTIPSLVRGSPELIPC